jgi:uncharacterized phage protein (TIGR01671 family)
MKSTRDKMTREIKFRAWDTIDEEWKYSGYPNMPLSQFWENVEDGIYINVCQSTGLHDKDGKEIWVGDILQYVNGLGEKGKIKGSVVLKKGAFKVERSISDPVKGKVNDLLHLYLKRHIVVGNIYEHSHLLNNK